VAPALPLALPALIAGQVPRISITGKPSVLTRAGYLGGVLAQPNNGRKICGSLSRSCL